MCWAPIGVRAALIIGCSSYISNNFDILFIKLNYCMKAAAESEKVVHCVGGNWCNLAPIEYFSFFSGSPVPPVADRMIPYALLGFAIQFYDRRIKFEQSLVFNYAAESYLAGGGFKCRTPMFHHWFCVSHQYPTQNRVGWCEFYSPQIVVIDR